MKIAIIGAGAMGGALARGLVENGGVDPANITVSNPSAGKLAPLAELGILTVGDNAKAVEGADLVVLAVKPWILPGVVNEILPALDPSTQEVTAIVAGYSGADLRAMFGDKCPKDLSISMPNTAMTVGQSVTFVVPVEGACKQALEVFRPVGSVFGIEERQLPGAMALASCGIALAMRYVRASVEGGVELGIRASEAQRIVCATIEGAAALLEVDGAHPESEIDKVTTPGGVTIKGLNAMERWGFSNSVIQGLKACAGR